MNSAESSSRIRSIGWFRVSSTLSALVTLWFRARDRLHSLSEENNSGSVWSRAHRHVEWVEEKEQRINGRLWELNRDLWERSKANLGIGGDDE